MIIKKEIEKRSYAVKFTAEKDGQEIGRVFLYIMYNYLHDEPFGYMEDLFVDEKFRGQGFGKNLVENVKAEAIKQNCYKLVFSCRCEKKELHDWYRNLGFKDVGLGFRMDFK
ncbi:MAG: GNAT family N-acetyltransferase [Patescibacteria group bacterium]|jgi:ribosomal protein S18 acetylase RimI-like enzyme